MTPSEKKRILRLLNSKEVEKVRANTLETGDVIILPLTHSVYHIKKTDTSYRFRLIQYDETWFEIKWTNKSNLEYGLNCQMWVEKKIIKNNCNG